MPRSVHMPRYLSLSQDIQTRIRAGEFESGDRLPSETELCRIYGVSRGTAVRAIKQLVAEGVAVRRQGSGTFVARPSMHRRSGRLLSFSETATSEGRDATQRLLSFGSADEALAREFHCERPAMSLMRLRLIDGKPCAYHHSLIPGHVARRVPVLATGEGLQEPHFSLYDAFDKVGFSIARADERVTARLATQDEAVLLNINRPSAVIVVFRRSFDADGTLIEVVEAVHDSAVYTYEINLERPMLQHGSDAPRRVHSFEAAVNRRAGNRPGVKAKEGN